MNKRTPLLTCQNISKCFQENNNVVRVLKKIDFTLQKHEKIAIIGASGSGKSTLLHILGGLEPPSTGEVKLLDQDLALLKDKVRSRIRNHYFGFIYQFHHLLPEFTVLENVCIPLLIRGIQPKQAIREATPLLEKAGLSHRIQHKPSEISGGERQRTAIVRAMVTKPACIFADEPTGNLDTENAQIAFNMLLTLSQTSIVLVTHDLQLAQRMDRILHMEDGYLSMGNP